MLLTLFAALLAGSSLQSTPVCLFVAACSTSRALPTRSSWTSSPILPPTATTSRRTADCRIAPSFKMLRVNGSLFFGAVDHVQRNLEQIDELNPRQKHVLLVASGINFVDLPGAEMLAREARRRRDMGGGLYCYRMKDAVREFLARGDHLGEIGNDNLFTVKSRPVGAIYRRLDPEICRHCRVRIFRECHVSLPNGEAVKPR